ncbi:AbiV family abortive infection protein [Streptomyces sp. NPDC056512]|uniref:AbiV family abortive infection protein n=1 Tax=Streptomyces sp. NPDC056512 TaxID=3345846 RepID=UPI0036A4AE48
MAKLPDDPALMARTLLDIASASFANARALLTSAEAVLDESQWPTSFSLGALALEEVGKAFLCMGLMGMRPVDREEARSTFEQAFTNHLAKAALAHIALAMTTGEVPASLEQLLEEAIEAAHRTNAVKFRGLYVDYTDAGALLKPDSIDEATAREMFATVTSALAVTELVEIAASNPDRSLDLYRQFHSEVDQVALEQHIDANPQEFFGHIRALVHDDVIPPPAFVGPTLSERLAAAQAALTAEDRPRAVDE